MRTRTIKQVIVGAMFLQVIAGCGPVGPDHEVPGMELPTSYSQGGVKWKKQSVGKEVKPQTWWKMYRDPELNRLVESALANNLEIHAASARLKQAREISNEARSAYFPNVDLGIGADRTKSRFRGPSGGSMLNSNFSIPVDLSYEIDAWGKLRRQVESAKASEGAASETLQGIRLSIASEVAQTYWSLRATDADIACLDSTLEMRRKALQLLGQRKDAGTISGLDYSRAENEVANAEASRIRLDRTRVEMINALSVLCGRVATSGSMAAKAELPKPPSIPKTIPSELLRQRPDIRAAERRVAAANASIGVATAAFYPNLTLNASTGLDSGSLSNLFQASSMVWSIGSRSLTPLTSQRTLNARRNAAIAAHEAASAEYRQTVLDAIREVENALQATTILERQQAVQEQALAAARKTFDHSVNRYKAGLVSFLDVVDAERTRLDAERTANAIRAERLAVSVSLIKSLGGEW